MNINEVSPKIAGVIGTRWLKLQTSGWNGVSQHFQIPYKQSHPGEIVWDRRYESWYIFHQQDAIWVCLKMSHIYIYTLWLFNISIEHGPFTDDFPN